MNPRVLIVEDQFLLALDLAAMLQAAGFDTVGPASTVATALELISSQNCDVAVIDVNLRNESSMPVAAALRSNDTPFVVVSGYAESQLPTELAGAPALTKPILPARLIAALQNCLTNDRRHGPTR